MSGRLRRWVDFAAGVPLSALIGQAPTQNRPARPIRKLLIIKLAAMGDTILLVPLLRSLRREHPELCIHWLVSRINEPIARLVPGVERLWLSPNGLSADWWVLAAQLRREQFDGVIDFEQWARLTGLIAWATGAPTRLGFDTPGQHRGSLYTHRFVKNRPEHELNEFYGLLDLAFPVAHDRRLELWDTDQGRQELTRLAPELLEPRSSRPQVLLHPGCGADGLPREWPIERFAALGRWLRDVHGADLWITSGPEEAAKADRLAQALGGEVRNLGGKLSWSGFLSLVKRMSLIISGNTGVMHVAAAWGRPQVALHGPTDARRWGPLNEHAAIIQSSCPQCPCLVLGFEYHTQSQACMERISLEEVQKAASRLLTVEAHPAAPR